MNNITLRKERIPWIDIARGICIISIVLGHTYHNSFIRTYTLSYDVPMFFFLSGLLYHFSEDTVGYILHRARKVVVPYISFSLLSILFFAIAGRLIPQITSIVNCSVVENVRVMLWGNSKPDIMKYNSPLWFLTCFFVVSVLAQLVEIIVRNFPWGSIRLPFILALIIVGGDISTPENIYPWHLETAVSMLVWFELGIWFNNNRIYEITERLKKYWIVLPLLSLGGVFGFINRNIAMTSLQVRQDIYGNHVFYYLSALLGTIGFSLLSQMIYKNKILEYCGKSSLFILLVHKFPILFFQQLFPFTKSVLSDSNSLLGIAVGLFIAFIAIVTSCVTCEMLMKGFPYIFGEKRTIRNR